MRLAFVTQELHPFGPGGIGRLVHNLVHTSLAANTSLEVDLLVSGAVPTATRIREVFGPRVALHAFEAGPRPEASCAAHALGLAARDRLLDLRRDGRSWDVVEFHDFGGLAFPALQAKRLGAGLAEAALRVRVHGPASLIAWLEDEPTTPDAVALFELERLALAHADEVVGPSGPVLDAVAEFFWLDRVWRQAARVEFPPVVWPPCPPTPAPPQASPKDLVFPTKLQRIKRPDLFIRAAVGLMRERRDWTGRARLLVPLGQSPSEAALRELVPPELAPRFLFQAADEDARKKAFAGNVVVVPSDFETSSLAAWEAATAGAQLVVNARCPGFAAGTTLAAWPGCHAFAGGAPDLQRALGRALDADPVSTPAVAATIEWRAPPSPPPARARPRCALIAALDGPPSQAPGHEIAECWYAGAEQPPAVWRHASVPPGAGEAEAWREAAARTECQLVLLVREGEAPPPAFVAKAIDALMRSPGATGVVCGVEIAGRRAPTLGATIVAGWLSPVAGGPGVYRREAVLELLALEGGREQLHLAIARTGRLLLVDEESIVAVAGPPPLPSSPRVDGLHPLALRAITGRALPLRYRLADRLDQLARGMSPTLRDRARRFFSR